MKRTWRAVTAAMVSSATMKATALLTGSPAQAATATPVPPSPNAVNAAGTLLSVRTWTEFTDHSGRSNYYTTETFAPIR
jgi:hypothetical protein